MWMSVFWENPEKKTPGRESRKKNGEKKRRPLRGRKSEKKVRKKTNVLMIINGFMLFWGAARLPRKIKAFCRVLTLYFFIFEAIWVSKMTI